VSLPRLLILPLLAGLAACSTSELTFDAWTAENLPAGAIDKNFKAATAITCLRGAQSASTETEQKSGGELHSYSYACATPDGSQPSNFWNIF
jgi:hypothetical protein